jgi:hypothetical protein
MGVMFAMFVPDLGIRFTNEVVGSIQRMILLIMSDEGVLVHITGPSLSSSSRPPTRNVGSMFDCRSRPQYLRESCMVMAGRRRLGYLIA